MMTRAEAQNALKSHKPIFGNTKLIEAIRVLNRKTFEPVWCNDEVREKLELAINELAKFDAEGFLTTILNYINHVEGIADSLCAQQERATQLEVENQKLRALLEEHGIEIPEELQTRAT